MGTAPGGSPTSSVPSMSKLTSFTPGIRHSLAVPARRSIGDAARRLARPINRSFSRQWSFTDPTPGPYTDSAMNRAAPSPQQIDSRGTLMTALFTAQVCGSTGHSIGMAVGSIMAAGMTGTNTWAGLPVAVGALGTALASWPLARLMDRSGRRPGLVLGYALSVCGAALGIVGMMTRSFPLLLVGMALFGIAQTSNLLARYAAADVSPGTQRGRAMGLIVWGSAVGSLIG